MLNKQKKGNNIRPPNPDPFYITLWSGFVFLVIILHQVFVDLLSLAWFSLSFSSLWYFYEPLIFIFHHILWKFWILFLLIWSYGSNPEVPSIHDTHKTTTLHLLTLLGGGGQSHSGKACAPSGHPSSWTGPGSIAKFTSHATPDMKATAANINVSWQKDGKPCVQSHGRLILSYCLDACGQ